MTIYGTIHTQYFLEVKAQPAMVELDQSTYQKEELAT